MARVLRCSDMYRAYSTKGLLTPGSFTAVGWFPYRWDLRTCHNRLMEWNIRQTEVEDMEINIIYIQLKTVHV